MSTLTAASLPTADTDIGLWLDQQTNKSLLRFLTCGSVDDGKSTLIGRLLYDSQLILDDQLATLKSDSRNRHVGDEGIDFSLLVDGLVAEREQGITIDVAYRFFSTDRRKFIVADTPGHEQYTRNMATGASNADLALLLVDARKGLLTQTRRHSFILSLIGVRHVVLVINKIDLMDYSQEVFDEIVADYKAFAKDLGFASLAAVPISALRGDNIVENSERTPWYTGTPLLPYLEEIVVDEDKSQTPFRFPVQWVNRPNLDFRGFRAPLPVAPSRWAMRFWLPPRASRPKSPTSLQWMAICKAPSPGRRSPLCSTARSTSRAATCSPIPATPLTIPTSSRPRSCGWPTSPPIPGVPIS